MKKLLFAVLTLLSCNAFAQATKENGVIYKEHPYITIVNKSTDLFLKQDWNGLAALYADTAKFRDPSSPTPYNLETAKKSWATIYDGWEQFSITPMGYPDGLKYDKDPFTVQSWWKVTCTNKKTKKTAKFNQVLFDEFNKDGKITYETSYYDQTPLIEATK